MKKIILLIMLVCLTVVMFVSGCSTPAEVNTTDSDATAAVETPNEPKAQNGEETQQSEENGEKEEYVWCCQFNSLPLFVNNDYIGMDIVAEELGVTVRKAGPQEIDLPAFISAIEQEITKKPAGMMVVGWDPSLKVAIDKAIEAGIPVVTVDADVPDSKRLCYIGTDWYQAGVEQAKVAAEAIGDQAGKVAFLGIPTADKDNKARTGYVEYMQVHCPNVTFLDGIYDSKQTAAGAAEVVSNLISSNADLIAVAGFDAACGPGIATAIKEAGKIGQIYGTCDTAEIEHLQAVKSGALLCAVGQKRQFMTYYGVKMLYDYNHSQIKFTEQDKELGIKNIPDTISTGFIVATADTVDALLEAAAAKQK